jgi:hypothetical protein
MKETEKGYLPFFHNRIQIGELIWGGEVFIRWLTPEGNELFTEALLFIGVSGEFK